MPRTMFKYIIQCTELPLRIRIHLSFLLHKLCKQYWQLALMPLVYILSWKIVEQNVNIEYQHAQMPLLAMA